MSAEAMARILVAMEIEHRWHAPYEQHSSNVLMPNGSIVASGDPAFLRAAVLAVSTPRTSKEIAA